MMGPPLCCLKDCVDLLERIPMDARLSSLKNLIVNNGGVWTVPERTERYAPFLYDVSFFGVTVATDDPDRLPALWIKAARNIIGAQQEAA